MSNITVMLEVHHSATLNIKILKIFSQCNSCVLFYFSRWQINCLCLCLQVLALVFIRKLLDFFFTKRELSWLDDLMPESKKKKEDDKKKRAREKLVKLISCLFSVGFFCSKMTRVTRQTGVNLPFNVKCFCTKKNKINKNTSTSKLEKKSQMNKMRTFSLMFKPTLY